MVVPQKNKKEALDIWHLNQDFIGRILSKLLFDAIESYTGSPNDGLAKITILPFSNQAGLIYLFYTISF